MSEEKEGENYASVQLLPLRRGFDCRLEMWVVLSIVILTPNVLNPALKIGKAYGHFPEIIC